MEKNIKGSKGANWNWVYLAQNWSWNEQNNIDLRWSGVQEDEEDIALANFIESLQKQANEKFFQKNYSRIFFMIVV